MSESSVRTVWEHQARWSQAADNEKSAYEVGRAVALCFVVGIAVTQTLTTTAVVEGVAAKALGFLAAGMGAAIPVIGTLFVSQSRLRDWTAARSTSEGLKSALYRHLARENGEARDLLDEFERVTADVDLPPSVAATTPEIDKPLRPFGLSGYLKKRVNQQICWYRKASSTNAKRITYSRLLQGALSVSAGLMAAYASSSDEPALGAWVAVLTTIGGAIATHVAAGRYDRLYTTYFVTATRLETLRDRFQADVGNGTPSAAEVSQFVEDCEAAISVENQAWMAGYLAKTS